MNEHMPESVDGQTFSAREVDLTTESDSSGDGESPSDLVANVRAALDALPPNPNAPQTPAAPDSEFGGPDDLAAIRKATSTTQAIGALDRQESAAKDQAIADRAIADDARARREAGRGKWPPPANG